MVGADPRPVVAAAHADTSAAGALVDRTAAERGRANDLHEPDRHQRSPQCEPGRRPLRPSSSRLLQIAAIAASGTVRRTPRGSRGPQTACARSPATVSGSAGVPALARSALSAGTDRPRPFPPERQRDAQAQGKLRVGLRRVVEPAREVGGLVVEHVEPVALAGPCRCSGAIRSASSSIASRWRSRMRGLAARRSGARARTDARSPAAGSARSPRSSTTTSDLSTSERAGRGSRPVESLTAQSGLGGVEREPAGEHRQPSKQPPARARSAGRGSNRPTRAASGGGAARCACRPVSKWNRSPSPAAICAADIIRTRAAASSIANGIPSRSWQIWATAGARSRCRRRSWVAPFARAR